MEVAAPRRRWKLDRRRHLDRHRAFGAAPLRLVRRPDLRCDRQGESTTGPRLHGRHDLLRGLSGWKLHDRDGLAGPLVVDRSGQHDLRAEFDDRRRRRQRHDRGRAFDGHRAPEARV